MQKICVVTGSAGFVGSHLVDHLLANTDWVVVGLDSFRHRGDAARVRGDAYRYHVYTCDLAAPISHRTMAQIERFTGRTRVDYVINMASESHVDRSISDPTSFIQNNINLELNVLEACRHWMPEHIIKISTDEVYGPALEGMKHVEWSEILPSNPYAASKAAQEAIAISYWRTYGMPITITNTMNMIGEYQDAEKYIPKIIAHVATGKTLTVHGSKAYIGKRHYLHARNHADALLYLLKHTKPSQYTDDISDIQRPNRWNIVGDSELNNLELAQMISQIMGKELKYELIDFHALTTRPGHDRRYALDGSKIAGIGWKAPVEFYQSLEKTVKWYLENPHWLK